MRGLKSTFLVGPLAVLVAVGLFWSATTRDQDSDTSRPPNPEKPFPPRGQALSQAPANAPGSLPLTPDTAEPERSPRASAVLSKQRRDDLTVWGTVRTRNGEVVAGKPIKLYSDTLQKTYTGFSSRQGEFVINNVMPAIDYIVTVSPKGMYQQYLRRDLTLDAGNAYLNIVLEPLQVGVLNGRIINPQGLSVPDFVIKVRSASPSRGTLRTRSDSVGLFQIDDFPKGPFEAFSRSMLLRIDGLMFDPDANEVITLVVDHGPHQLSGRVFNQHGQHVSGASVLLSWEHVDGDVRSTVLRRTLTDAEGGFAMDGLAFGRHELVVSSTDGAVLERSVMIGEVAADLVLYLDRRGSHAANRS